MNNNLIINSTSLQPLILSASKILHHWLDTNIWWEKESSLHVLLIRTSVPKDRKWIISSQLPLMESETSHIKTKLSHIQCFFLFADDDIKTDDLELYFCKVLRYNCFFKKLYTKYFNLFTRKDLLERCLLERIKSLASHLQFVVGQKHNVVGHLILPRVFPVGQNIQCVFRLVVQILFLVGHSPISDRYFKIWHLLRNFF